jgi:hypothetical protein
MYQFRPDAKEPPLLPRIFIFPETEPSASSNTSSCELAEQHDMTRVSVEQGKK